MKSLEKNEKLFDLVDWITIDTRGGWGSVEEEDTYLVIVCYILIKLPLTI